MLRNWLGAAVVGALVSTAGCADVDDAELQESLDTDTEGEEDVEKQLAEKAAALGFDTTDIAFVGQYIRVEGDIILDRELLLSGAYDGPAEHEPGAAIQKGYRTPSLISSSSAGNVKLQWLTSTNPNTTIRNAFINAAGDINSVWASRCSSRMIVTRSLRSIPEQASVRAGYRPRGSGAHRTWRGGASGRAVPGRGTA